ncbi:DnaJ protein, putative [Hepatocystis sp. ex Piliocolobus tephrosceles]|nr:DnaJ protein, putative [Hepatocystis sp. ex Piliocolobus tephrosceles]
MIRKPSFNLNKLIFVISSHVFNFCCKKEKKKLYYEIIEHVKNSKIINYPIDKYYVNFFFVSNEIYKYINIIGKLSKESKSNNNESKLIFDHCLNLYYLLLASGKLKKNNNFFRHRILEYIEEILTDNLKKKKLIYENVQNKNIPYSLIIKNETSVKNLMAELNNDCSAYLRKINNIKVRHLIINKNEINMSEEWKKKNVYAFNRNKLKIPISKHNYEFILNGCNDSSMRRKILELLNEPYKNINLDNDVIKILKKRYDIANKLGYENWCHYSISKFTSEKNNYKNIKSFLNLIKKKIDKDHEQINRNINKISNLNRNDKIWNSNNNLKKLPIYDWYYFFNKILNGSDEYLINTFFPQEHVLKNFIDICSKIYNFSYEKVSITDDINKINKLKIKWPKNSCIYKISLPEKLERWGLCGKQLINDGNVTISEKKYNISNDSEINDNENLVLIKKKYNNRLLGYIYLIPYSDIKLRDYFKIPSMQGLSNTCLILPGHVLIDYNFIRCIPIKNKLFSISEILTLFHEFGHAYHLLLLSNKYKLKDLFHIPIDYAEFFSHINEYITNNYNIMYNLSGNIKSNTKICEKLFNTIKFDNSRLSNIYYPGVIDYTLHTINPYTFFSNGTNDMYSKKHNIMHDVNKGDSNIYKNTSRVYTGDITNNPFDKFYNMIEIYFPYTFSSSYYTLHSSSFPYHFSGHYAGSVLSYLFAEVRVLLNIPFKDISLKKNDSLYSFQKTFYKILSQDFRSETYPSVIAQTLDKNKNMFLVM